MIGFALAGPEKMAIAGDDKWQDDAFAFTAKGFRATPSSSSPRRA
jgi:hypothetical protein